MILIWETAFKAPASCPECLSESAKHQSIPTVPDLFITNFLVINQDLQHYASCIPVFWDSLKSCTELGCSNVHDLLWLYWRYLHKRPGVRRPSLNACCIFFKSFASILKITNAPLARLLWNHWKKHHNKMSLFLFFHRNSFRIKTQYLFVLTCFILGCSHLLSGTYLKKKMQWNEKRYLKLCFCMAFSDIQLSNPHDFRCFLPFFFLRLFFRVTLLICRMSDNFSMIIPDGSSVQNKNNKKKTDRGCLFCATILKGEQQHWTVGMQWDGVEANLCSRVNKTDLWGFSHLLERAWLAVILNPALSENRLSPPDGL